MSLLEQEATRMAAALADYERLSVIGIGGTHESGYRVRVRDERLRFSYEIGPHADYWDFLGYFAAGPRWPVKTCPHRGGDLGDLRQL